MVRILGLFGLAVLFLTISADLRNSLMELLAKAVQGLENYSPWSYAAVALAVIGGFLFSLKRGAQPR